MPRAQSGHLHVARRSLDPQRHRGLRGTCAAGRDSGGRCLGYGPTMCVSRVPGRAGARSPCRAGPWAGPGAAAPPAPDSLRFLAATWGRGGFGGRQASGCTGEAGRGPDVQGGGTQDPVSQFAGGPSAPRKPPQTWRGLRGLRARTGAACFQFLDGASVCLFNY